MPTKPSKIKGKQFHRCDVCNNKTVHASVAKIPFRLRYQDQTFPQETVVCSRHNDVILPADHPYWALVDQPVSREMLADWLTEIEEWISQGQPDDMSDNEWEWLIDCVKDMRVRLPEVSDTDLVVFRNGVMDLVIKARNISVYDQSGPVFG